MYLSIYQYIYSCVICVKCSLKKVGKKLRMEFLFTHGETAGRSGCDQVCPGEHFELC